MGKCEKKEVIINGVTYVPKTDEQAESLDGMEFLIIRTYSAGVFAGYMQEVSEDGKQVVLRQAIRLHAWQGAASLSQMAMEGTNEPDCCRFAMPMSKLCVTEAIERISCTLKAQKSIQGVKSWKV